MHILVYDTIALLQPIFTLRARPKEVFAQAQEPIFGQHGLNSLMPLERHSLERMLGGYPVMQAVKQDGYDVMVGQQAWGLFDPGRSKDASEWQFSQFLARHVLETLRTSLHTCAEILPSPAALAHIECLLLPADPTNQNLMVMNHGLSGFAGLPGYLFLQLWPGTGNLARLGPALARLYLHNLRWALTPTTQTITLGDMLVLEGLSAAFITTMFPDIPSPWLVSIRQPDDWQETLSHVARLHGVNSYDEIKCNIYGMQFLIGDAPRPPTAQPLEPDELEYVRDLIDRALTTTDARLIAAYLYGDELTALQGHPTVGLPPYAGFEFGYHLVQAYLQQSGQSLAEAIATPSQEILAWQAT
ncbi:MAG TPA: DUF2268 domain-containing putative Zn-dependent protease [Ktedonosporobacter sp.]|nr:DUF2268 domain-containing putative Zn-dependent protease [Ktedonosporobacter sp.]